MAALACTSSTQSTSTRSSSLTVRSYTPSVAMRSLPIEDLFRTWCVEQITEAAHIGFTTRSLPFSGFRRDYLRASTQILTDFDIACVFNKTSAEIQERFLRKRRMEIRFISSTTGIIVSLRNVADNLPKKCQAKIELVFRTSQIALSRLNYLQRTSTPLPPTGFSLSAADELFVMGETSRRLEANGGRILRLKGIWHVALPPVGRESTAVTKTSG